MNYVIFALTVVAVFFIAAITVNKEFVDKIKILNWKKSDEQFESKSFSKRTRIAIIVFMTLTAAVAAFFMARDISIILNQVKFSIALVCLVGVGVNDFREHRIPNFFSIVMAAVGAVSLGVGYLLPEFDAKGYLVSSLFATIGVTVCLGLAALLTKQGIGMGDIKALGALSLVGGVNAICGTMFFGMIAFVLCAIVLLASRKKKLSEAVPFGPFIYIGFVLAILLKIY